MSLDVIWLIMIYASSIVLIAVASFITIKIGLFAYNVVMDAVSAVKKVENIEGPIEFSQKADSSEDKGILSLLADHNSLKKAIVKRNYTRYAYMQLFKK
ncbi:hypothetical protein [Methanobacterium sp. ACI-7]|uniref:hypothetical protein n=1 Tax=unclassified Methanobacterium TaxID=2627676 RepID=UPI0039C30CD0